MIKSDYCGRTLYEKAKKVDMTSPVRKIGYVSRLEMTKDMAIAGEILLAEATMLNPSRLMTYAVYASLLRRRNWSMNWLILMSRLDLNKLPEAVF